MAIAAFVVGRGFWWTWNLSQELRRIEAAGEPTTPEGLATFYRLPAGAADATDAWNRPLLALSQRALGRYPYGLLLLDQGELPPPPGTPWPKRDKAIAFLAKHAALLGQTDAALATSGECCYLTNFDDGYQTVLPHVQYMRDFTRLLLLRAYVHAHAGEDDEAVEDIIGALRAAETLGREPVMVTQTVRLARHKETLAIIEDLLPRLRATDAQLKKLQQTLSRIDYHPALALAVIGERVSGITAFENPMTAGASKMSSPAYRFVVRDDLLSYLQSMQGLLDSVRSDWPGPLQATEHIQGASIGDLQVAPPWGGPAWAAPSGILGPIRELVERAASGTAKVHAAALGVAAVRIRRERGRWPESLEELAPHWTARVPLDPFTGEPLLMQRFDSGVRFYSVGLNGRDDGGIEDAEPAVESDAPRKGDIVFSVGDE